MKNLLFCLLSLVLASACQKTGYEKTMDGVVVHLPQTDETGPRTVQLHVVTDDIIHVLASPTEDFSVRKSLMIEEKQFPAIDWTVVEEGNRVILRTARLSASVSHAEKYHHL